MPRGVLGSGVSVALVLAMISVPVSAFAQSSQPEDPPPRKTSGLRRVIGTLVGGGIGLGAGMLFGMIVFEDSVDSDRKGWTAAATGAALGALIGNLSSRQVKTPSTTKEQPRLRSSWPAPRPGRDAPRASPDHMPDPILTRTPRAPGQMAIPRVRSFGPS